MNEWRILQDNASQIVDAPARSFGLDLTIESMLSQRFSVGIFIFLIIGIAVFTAFVFAYLRMGRNKHLKRGEIWLFVWILFGVVAAIAFGASQLLYGNLF